jgi:MFS family permease
MEHSPATATQTSPTAGSPSRRATSASARWAIVITSLALFMATLDNLVVTTALPVIRRHLHAGLAGLEWTVNAYTLTFAVRPSPCCCSPGRPWATASGDAGCSSPAW